MKETQIIFDSNKSTIEYIGYYQMLDKIVELMDKMPEHIPSLIESYERILELIVRLKESDK